MTANNVVKLFKGEPSAIELFQDDTNGEAQEDYVDVEEIAEDAKIDTFTTLATNKLNAVFQELNMEAELAPKEFCFIVESIISFIYTHHDRKHPLQSLAEGTIEIIDEDGLVFKFIEPKIHPIEGTNGNID